MNNIEKEVDKEIIETILDVLNIEYEKHKYFNNGASSRVILLNDKYLIKQNSKNILRAEVEFLTLNNSNMFQKIIYFDPNYKFVVYKFISGDTMKNVEDVEDTLQKIIKIASNYHEYKKEGYGYLNEEVETWSQFLEDEINDSSLNLQEYITEKTVVNNSIKNLEKYPFNKKLLHGDFGTHNFIKENGKLVGVIDPMPVIGDYLYDLLFAIVSNVQILSKLSIEKLYEIINEPKEKIKSMLIIVLYSRISRCLKYHPQDINIYMSYWNKIIKE